MQQLPVIAFDNSYARDLEGFYVPWTGSRGRLHLGEPGHCACDVNEGLVGGDSLFATQGDAAEPFDLVEEALDEVAFLVEHPVDRLGSAARRVLLDLSHGTKFLGDEGAQVVGVVACIHDDMAHPLQPLDQPARLGAVTPVAGGDQKADRQAERIDCGMDLGRQATTRAADTGSLRPPF